MTATAKVTHDETEFDRVMAEARAANPAWWDATLAQVEALLRQPQPLSLDTSTRPSAANFLEC